MLFIILQENENLNKSKMQDKLSLDSNELNDAQTSPTDQQSANDSSAFTTGNLGKRVSLFSLWNKKKSPDILHRRTSLPILKALPHSQSFSSRFMSPLTRRFSASEKQKGDTKEKKHFTQNKEVKRSSRNDSSILQVRPSCSKLDSVSSDDVFETAKSSTTTGSNLSLSQESDIPSRKSDGDISVKFAASENKSKFLEPSPRTRRGKYYLIIFFKGFWWYR